MALIEVCGVHKYYASGDVKIAALAGIDLHLETGAFAVLAGPSGSGKTTLLNIIGALDRPDRGRVRVSGRDLTVLSAAERARFRLHHVGFVFQSYNLIRVLTAQENVAYVLQLQGVPASERNERAQRLLAEVGLKGLEKRRPDQLSGGQQQRIAVARALASESDIVLADEPTANLDSRTGEALVRLMRRLNAERNITFLTASHDPVVIRHSRRLIRMRDGRIVD